MATNLIELVIKGVVEGTADVSKLTEVIEQLREEAEGAAQKLAASTDATLGLAGSAEDIRKALAGSLADFTDQIDGGIVKVQELRAALEASGGAELPEIAPLIKNLQDLEDFYSGIKSTFDLATQSAGIMEEAIAKVQEGLRAGVKDVQEFEKFLSSDGTPGLNPADLLARDIFPGPEFFEQTTDAIQDTTKSATELEQIYSKLAVESIEALAQARQLAAAKEVPLSAAELDRASTSGLLAGLDQIAEAAAKNRDIFELLAQESRDALRIVESESSKAATGLRGVADAGGEAAKSVAELERLSATGLAASLDALAKATQPKTLDELQAASAAGFNARMAELAEMAEEADRGLNNAKLSVQELDAEIARLSQTLAGVNVDIDTGELRKFVIDTARQEGVGEGVVSGVMAELATSIEGLTEEQLENLTRGVVATSRAFKTDFIETAEEAAAVVNGLSNTIKDTTVTIDEMVKPQDRAAALTAELNENLKGTGNAAREGGQGMEVLNTAMTSFGSVAATLNPTLGRLQVLLGSFTRSAVPIAAIAALTAGIIGLAKSAADAGSELRRTAQINGFTVETVSALKVAAEQSDSSLAQLSIGLRTLNREFAQAITQGGAAQKKFIDLGLTFDQLQDFYVDSEAGLEAVARRITATASATERTRLAIQLFGRQGRELLPLLREIAEKGLGGLREEAERAGLIVSSQTANAAKIFNDNLTTLNQTVQGFVFRSMAPLLESFNKFVSDSPAIVEAIGAITLGFGAFVLVLGTLKIASLLGVAAGLNAIAGAIFTVLANLAKVIPAFTAVAAAVVAHPYITAALAIAAAAVAIYGVYKQLTEVSKATGLSFDELAEKTLTAKEKLAELERNGKGATKAADDLRAEIVELSEAVKDGEARLKALNDQLAEIEKRKAGNISKDARDALTELEKRTRAQLKAEEAVLNSNKKPFEKTDQDIKNTARELDNLILSGRGASESAEALRAELTRLKALLVTQVDAELASLNVQLADLRENGGSADSIRKVSAEIERLQALREKGVGTTVVSETAKQFQEQVAQLQIQLQKSIAQAAQQTTTQLLQETGNVNEFFGNIAKQIDKVRELSRQEIDLQFAKDKATVDPAVAEQLRAARLAQADLQRDQQLSDARAKASETQLKFEQDRQGAIEAAAKAQESLQSTRIEGEKQNLEYLIAEVSTLDQVLDRAKQIAAQQRAILELSIKNNEQRRQFIADQLQETSELEDSEVTPNILRLRAEHKTITAEIEKQRNTLKESDAIVADTLAKFHQLRTAAKIEADITIAETSLDTLRDQLSKLEIAQDLGAKVPFSEFLDLAKKIDAAERSINAAHIERQELLVKEIQLKVQSGRASDEQLKAAEAQLARLRNQAAINANAEETRRVVELERKIDEVASSTAKGFVDRLLEGLENKKFDFQKFFEGLGKTLFADLLQEAIKEAQKPVLRDISAKLGEKPADTLGGQFIQSIKLLLQQLGVNVQKKEPELTPAEKAAKQTVDSAKEGAAAIKTSAEDSAVKLTDAGGVLHTAGDNLILAAKAFIDFFNTKVPAFLTAAPAAQSDKPSDPLTRALASIESRVAQLDQKRESLQADLSVASTDELRAAISDNIDRINAEIAATNREKDLTLAKFSEGGAKAFESIARGADMSAQKFSDSAFAVKSSAESVSAASATLRQCYCSGVKPAASALDVFLPPDRPIKVESVDPEVPLSDRERSETLAIEIDAFRIAAGGLLDVTDDLDQAIKSLDEFVKPPVKLAGAEPRPTSTPEINVSVTPDEKAPLSASPSPGQSSAPLTIGGLDLNSLIGPGLGLLTGFGALQSQGEGIGGFLTKLQGGIAALKGGLELYQQLAKLFPSATAATIPGLGGSIDAFTAGSSLAGSGSGGGFLDSIFGFFKTIGGFFGIGGAADGGMFGFADGGAIFPNQLGNMVSAGHIRKFRTGDSVRGPVLGVIGEEGPEIVARMKPAGAHDNYGGPNGDGEIKQTIYIVDQRKPNLGPEEIELVVSDSMARGRKVAKAVENVIKRKG